MKKKIRLTLLSFLLGGILIAPVSGFAQTNGENPAVQNGGVIEFYEEEVKPSESSEPADSSSQEGKPTPTPTPGSSTKPSSGGASVSKPTGKYPSTGELVQKSMTYSGIALVLIAFLIFLWKRRKKEEDEA